VILDSSAVLAVFQNEPGANIVMQHFGSAAISAANFCEVITVAQKKGLPGDYALRQIDVFDLEVVAVTKAHARAAALMWPIAESAGLSMGDRICLALALERDDEVLTADRAWAMVAHGAKVTFIR
jgi:ribonuclease VapC